MPLLGQFVVASAACAVRDIAWFPLIDDIHHPICFSQGFHLTGNSEAIRRDSHWTRRDLLLLPGILSPSRSAAAPSQWTTVFSSSHEIAPNWTYARCHVFRLLSRDRYSRAAYRMALKRVAASTSRVPCDRHSCAVLALLADPPARRLPNDCSVSSRAAVHDPRGDDSGAHISGG